MKNSDINIQSDVDAVNSISIVPTLLQVICRTMGMGFAVIARVTEEKWVACAVLDEIQFGLEPGGELKLETTICNEIRMSQEAVIIDNVDQDEVFFGHPTPAMYGFKSYISIPIIRRDGSFFGTLCAIDPKPANLNTPETIGLFKLFADLISFHLDTVDQIAISQKKLLEELETAKVREQFIAILGHDLLNPVGAVFGCSQLLLEMPLDEEAAVYVNIIKRSCSRMAELIRNVLDFARGRMGNGITLKRNADELLEKTLTQVITELGIIWPDRDIETQFDLEEPVDCDDRRIAQLFSNLLGNAITHGKKDTPIRVKAISGKGEFVLSVANAGNKIPVAAMNHLFKPFSRGEEDLTKGGLGLGLYIASEIANAHGGKLDVESSHEETKFTLRMAAKQAVA